MASKTDSMIPLEEPPKKRSKRTTISERVMQTDFQSKFSEHWHGRVALESADLCVLTRPFRLCKISNFIGCKAFMEDLKAELAEVKSRRQSIDLYQFEQTSDLATVDSPNLRRLWETFRTELASWMETNTKIELNGKMSMSSSVYYDTDYLLCHDDNLGDRRIAFVLYLSKDWHAEDGGTLDLFDTDENGAPRSLVRSLVPEYNSLIFFEVHNDSYHQVSEVKSAEKSRWTINGWFHGPLVESAGKVRPESEVPLIRPDLERPRDISPWIRNYYLDANVAKDVQKMVEADSYTFLPNFFLAETYEKLSEEIASEEIIWRRVGPPDVRNYEIAVPESLPEKLREFYQLFANIEVFALLKDYTELDLVPNVKDEGDPRMSIELQRWSNGCYTLMRDKGISGEEETISSRNEADRVSKKDPEDRIAATGTEDTPGAMNTAHKLPSSQSKSSTATSQEKFPTRSSGNKLPSDGAEDKFSSVSDDDKFVTPSSEETILKVPGFSEKKLISGGSFEKPAPPASQFCRVDKRETRKSEKDETREDKIRNSPSGSSGTDESSDSVILKRLLKGKGKADKKGICHNVGQHEASCSSVDEKSEILKTESEDSDVSDIGDYLSDRFECSIDNSGEEDEEEEEEEDEYVEDEDECAASPSTCEPGSLDVIVQFNTGQVPTDETIDYVDPNQQEGALIHVPFKDNHLCLVYKTIRTTRLHKYVNHYCKGYFYNLICTYYE